MRSIRKQSNDVQYEILIKPNQQKVIIEQPVILSATTSHKRINDVSKLTNVLHKKATKICLVDSTNVNDILRVYDLVIDSVSILHELINFLGKRLDEKCIQGKKKRNKITKSSNYACFSDLTKLAKEIVSNSSEIQTKTKKCGVLSSNTSNEDRKKVTAAYKKLYAKLYELSLLLEEKSIELNIQAEQIILREDDIRKKYVN